MFVPVPAASFDASFAPKGFSKIVVSNEVVYEIAHKANPAYRIRVYTSLSHGAEVCRAKGSDAVRACLVWVDPKTNKARGLGKATRVNRTGSPESVVERAVARARECYALANSFIAAGPCHCGSPRWPDSKRCVNKCWAH